MQGQFHRSCFLTQWVKYLIGEWEATDYQRYSDLFVKNMSLRRIGPDQEVLGPAGYNVPTGHVQDGCIMSLDINGKQRKSPVLHDWVCCWEVYKPEVYIWLVKKTKTWEESPTLTPEKNFPGVHCFVPDGKQFVKDQWKDIKMNKEKHMYIHKHYPFTHTGCWKACFLSISFCTLQFPTSFLKYVCPKELKQKS